MRDSRCGWLESLDFSCRVPYREGDGPTKAVPLRLMKPLRKLIKPKVPLLAAELWERGRTVRWWKRLSCEGPPRAWIPAAAGDLGSEHGIDIVLADDNVARKVRESVAAAVEHGIELMLAEREADPNRSVVGRLLRSDG
ncbi:hypothetical protein BST27_29125 [Mycobacterium intermedium]|uniref:Uncharacterized protein n=2 Tax=Mycobacterium intermedium TaxID=28445 RepID=A0A1E3SEU4_MYCIE|nr:hypothetical protein BHQ20_11670 [Mycobacterium intermedium]ORA93157.1 hypothetical protein BST27_29125 [Mycobacterium intermedium]